MKYFNPLLLFTLLFFLSFQLNAQEKLNCRLGNFSFVCPENLEKDSTKNSDDFLVALNSKNQIYVFAFTPNQKLETDDLINQALKKAFDKTYSTNYSDYQIKNSEDFWGNATWSKYEVSKFAKVGFNKNRKHTIHFQFVQLSLNDKQIVAGFVYELAVGELSKSRYNNWLGGGNGDASSNLQELIKSITGEVQKTETPGGPPPAAGK